MSRKPLAIVFAALVPFLLPACTHEHGAAENGHDKGTEKAHENDKDAGHEHGKGGDHDHAHEYDVQCGCAFREDKKCGEYIKVEGKMVPLTGVHFIAPMPFCGKKGLKADATGAMKDGKFVAESFELKQ